MGVGNKAAYQKIKQELAIPPEEPIFIFRAQDIHSVAVLEVYRNIVAGSPGEQRFVDGVQQAVRDFHNYQMNHPERVKEPD